MGIPPGFFAGYPLALSARQCGFAIQADSDFQGHPGNTAGHPTDETPVQVERLVMSDTHFHLDAGLL